MFHVPDRDPKTKPGKPPLFCWIAVLPLPIYFETLYPSRRHAT
jgi:hypothetical protein